MEDDFAQSRGADDLFADEIDPAEATQQYLPTPAVLTAANIAAHTSQQESEAITQSPPSFRPRNNARRGNGTLRGANATQPPRAPPPQQQRAIATPPPPAPTPPPGPAPPFDTATVPSASVSHPQQPQQQQQQNRVTSVRGDRSATGPAKPQKRTEEELNALMASMQVKNAAKSEAHARAEQDEAAYLRREEQAAAKRMEERRSVREMDMERAKNRERKIRAQGGREWDSEKTEADIVDGRSRGGSSQYTRGAHGGVRALDDSRYHRGGMGQDSGSHGTRDSIPEPSERGKRGGRGGGGRGGRGRGGGIFGSRNAAGGAPAVEDFPSLPPAPVSAKVPAQNASPADVKPLVGGSGLGDSSWADEVEKEKGSAK